MRMPDSCSAQDSFFTIPVLRRRDSSRRWASAHALLATLFALALAGWLGHAAATPGCAAPGTDNEWECFGPDVTPLQYGGQGADGWWKDAPTAAAAVQAILNAGNPCGLTVTSVGNWQVTSSMMGLTLANYQSMIYAGKGLPDPNPDVGCNKGWTQLGDYGIFGGNRVVRCPADAFVHPNPANLGQYCYREKRCDVCKIGNPIRPLEGAKDESITIQGFRPVKLYYSSRSRPAYVMLADGSTTPVPFEIAQGWTMDYLDALLYQPASVLPGMTFDQAWWLRADGRHPEFHRVSGVWTQVGDLRTNLALSQPIPGRWQFVDQDAQYLEYFDESAPSIKWRYLANGNWLKMTTFPDSSLLRVRVENQFGRRIDLMSASAGAPLTQIVTGTGTVTLTQEDIHTVPPVAGLDSVQIGALITKLTYEDGKSTGFSYEGAGSRQMRMIGNAHEDETGVLKPYMSATYSPISGRVLSSEHPGGVNKWQVSESGTQITTPLGTVYDTALTSSGGSRRIWYSSQPAGAGAASVTTGTTGYDARGNITEQTNFNWQKTVYAYDSVRSLETARIEGLDFNASVSALTLTTLPAGARKISTQWHPNWALKTRVAEPKRLTTFVYNGQSDPTNANAILNCTAAGTPLLPTGAPVAVLCKKVVQETTDASGVLGFGATTTGTPRIWSYTYNTDSQILTENGPRTDVADVTTYEYYTANDTAVPPKFLRGDLKRVTNAASHINDYTNYDGNGRLTRQVDANGLVTTVTYHPRGWIATVATSNGTTTETTAYTYFANGRLKKVTRPDGSFLNYGYDAALRLTSITDNLSNSVIYTLDNMGNRTKEEFKDTGGVLRRQIARAFDPLNRLQSVTGALQ